MTKENKSTARLPWAKREAGKVNRIATRLANLHHRVKKAVQSNPNEQVAEALNELATAIAACGEAADSLDIVDDSYRPTSRRKKAAVEEGTIVKITDKQRESYLELLDSEDELENLEVIKVKGNKLAVKAETTGARFFVTRGHVQVQPTAE